MAYGGSSSTGRPSRSRAPARSASGRTWLSARTALEQLGPDPFPPELDAGTVTESGGDTYAIARMLAAGQRVVYDPATFVYHRHRADGRALHRAVFGYGVGLGAALTRLFVCDRELSTPRPGSGC